MKVLVATQKPFAAAAVSGIKEILEAAGHQVVLLEKYAAQDDLVAAVADADALIVRSDKVTPEVIAAAKNLKIVVRAGAGFDNVDLPAASARGIVVMNTPGQNSNAVAELAIGLMIYMSRNQFTPGTGRELKGKTVGIHAYGNVGRLVAMIAKNGFGMNVIAFDPFVPAEKMAADGVKAVASIEELYANSDFLSLHIPLPSRPRTPSAASSFRACPREPASSTPPARRSSTRRNSSRFSQSAKTSSMSPTSPLSVWTR